MSKVEAANPKKPMCGLVMPISGSDDYTSEHWSIVRLIIEECLTELGFESRMVSEGNEIGIIHGRIVENLYTDPLIICDVSSRNPNVMFELGMRITFDKPVVIIKDDETSKIFDIDIIEFISYPKSLQYNIIQKFKIVLKEKIKATYEAGQSGKYSPFLNQFKDVKATKLQEKEVEFEDLVNKKFDDIYALIQNKMTPIPYSNRITQGLTQVIDQSLSGFHVKLAETFIKGYIEEHKDKMAFLKLPFQKQFEDILYIARASARFKNLSDEQIIIVIRNALSQVLADQARETE
jgi:hypothetical protein